ncbi:hypothetical protein BAE46_13205 [Glaciecola punicea]|nr:hypothetical protein BAE46_13205 [Glaciecola punicea]
MGLVIIDDKKLSGPGAGGLLGLGSCTLRIVLLASDSNSQPVVALMTISEAEIPNMPTPPEGIAAGQAATVFQITNFDEICAQLENDGLKFLCAPVEYPKPTSSPGSPAGLYKEMIFFDPDNNLISLLEIIPKK